jgi:F0F1-type ATP synthase delta subunit
MKYSTHDYAKALVEAIDDPKADHAAVGKHFLALVRKNSDEARLKKILDEASRLVRGKGGSREVVVECARPLAKSQEKMIAPFLKPGDTVSYAMNPNLVAGIKIMVNDEMEFDGSLKGKLDALFGEM